MHFPVLVLAAIGCPLNQDGTSTDATCEPQYITTKLMLDSNDTTSFDGSFKLKMDGKDLNEFSSQLVLTPTIDGVLNSTLPLNGTSSDLTKDDVVLMFGKDENNGTNTLPKVEMKEDILVSLPEDDVKQEKKKLLNEEPIASQKQKEFPMYQPPKTQKKHRVPLQQIQNTQKPTNYGFNPAGKGHTSHTQTVPENIVAVRAPYTEEIEQKSPLGNSYFQRECLASHNRIRVSRGLPILIWDSTLASNSYSYSDSISMNGGYLQHSTGQDSGENLYSSADQNAFVSCDHAVKSWLSEEGLYVALGSPEINMQNYFKVGHFTQVAWKNTRRVGCGHSQQNGVVSIVCKYFPAGNVIGEKPY